MKYSITDFYKEFPNSEACLDVIFKERKLRGYKRVKGRMCYQNRKGKQIYPLKGTIFEGIRTPLTKWFYAIYLFSVSKNGVSALELQRQLGVTYKCAWRMGHKIRELMTQPAYKTKGVVEIDETYIGGKKRTSAWFKKKTPIVGMVTRNGHVRVKVIQTRGEIDISPFIEQNLTKGSRMITDEAPVYKTVSGYRHRSVNHSKREYVVGSIHTNNIENFWGQLKRSLDGTFHGVSRKLLQKYAQEFAFRYNFREKSFRELLSRVV